MQMSFSIFRKADFSYLLIALSLAIAGFALATTQKNEGPLENAMKAYLVKVDDAGKEILTPARAVEPGQTVEYKLTYKNVSNGPLTGLIITGPVPSATHYVSNSAKAIAASMLKVSIDGGKSFEKEPVKRMVKNAKGKMEQKVIPPSQYTHIRWEMMQPLQAGETQQFAYRSVVK